MNINLVDIQKDFDMLQYSIDNNRTNMVEYLSSLNKNDDSALRTNKVSWDIIKLIFKMKIISILIITNLFYW